MFLSKHITMNEPVTVWISGFLLAPWEKEAVSVLGHQRLLVSDHQCGEAGVSPSSARPAPEVNSGKADAQPHAVCFLNQV